MRTSFAVGMVLAVSAVMTGGGGFAPGAGAQTLEPIPIFCDPPDDPVTHRPVEKGLKGLRFYYQSSVAGGYPINVAGATVQLQIAENAPITCLPTFPPPPNGASYVADNDAVKIFYNGTFPPNTLIKYWATGVKSATGVAQTPTNPPVMTTFLTGSDTPRTAVQVEMVFDISGSMALPPINSPKLGDPPSRIAALQGAAQTFLMLLGQQARLDDRVGVAYFSTTASVFNPGGGPSNMASGVDKARVGAIQTDILSKTPTNSTSIGAGLNAANDQGFTLEPPGNPAARKVVLLFSDGEQNTAPNVAVSGPNVQVAGSTYNVDQIIPITAGDLSSPGNTLQAQISAAKNNNNGTNYGSFHVLTGTDLNTYFTQSLADILVGDKLEVVRDVTGTITRGQTVKQNFLANTNDVSLSIVLHWSAPDNARISLPFVLTSPDGSVVDLKRRTEFGRNTSVTTVRFPLGRGAPVIFFQPPQAADKVNAPPSPPPGEQSPVIPPKGEWTITFNAANIELTPINYQLIVLLDNPSLATSYQIAARDVGVGETIPVHVRVTDKGAPVKNAAVVAEMIGPAGSMGNIVATSATPQGTPNYGGDTVRNDAQKKLLLLLADPSKASLFGTAGLPQLTLLDDGGSGSGDQTAGEGVYSARFTGADKEGHYRLQITALGKSSQGDFQRTQVLTFFARPKADKSKTKVELLPAGTDPRVIGLKVTPKDAADNFLGPDYLGLLKVKSSEGTVQQDLADKLDGSYEISYQLPSASSNPTITVSVGPATVVTTTLNDLRGGGVDWWVWVLIALVVIVLLLLIWVRSMRKRTA